LLKQAFSSVVALFVYFGKLDLAPIGIREFFSANSFPEPRAEAFSALYAHNVSALRALLNASSFHFPHVVDVQWRVDYQVRSDSLDRINAPTFYVTLKTLEHGVQRDVAFACSLEEMTDLVAKLKDAAGAVEHIDIF